MERSAHLEAISHLTRGLELLETLPDTMEHRQQELELQTTLGPALMATKGYAAPDVGHTYARARELCQQVGATPQLFPVLWGLGAFYGVRAEHQTAQELAEQLLTLAQREPVPGLLLEAHLAQGVTLFYLGEFVPARTHFAQGLALYDLQQHRSHAFSYGQDPGMVCLSFMAWMQWWLGHPDAARARSQAALTLAQQTHPFSLAHARAWAASFHQFRRDGQAAQTQAEAAIARATEQGFLFWMAWVTIVRGWALVVQGQAEAGIPQMRQGLAAYRATGGEGTGRLCSTSCNPYPGAYAATSRCGSMACCAVALG